MFCHFCICIEGSGIIIIILYTESQSGLGKKGYIGIVTDIHVRFFLMLMFVVCDQTFID